MRLSPQTVAALVQGLAPYLSGSLGAELLLFGSRVNNAKRGGDIDLLLLVEENGVRDRVRDAKLDILVAWKSRIGDQRIDFRIASRAEAASDAFLETVLPGAVCLNKW